MTPLGILIAAVGLLALMARRKFLYALFIFSIPFSGTSVLNVGSGANASGVQVWMYFGLLLLLRELVAWILHPDLAVTRLFARRAFLFLFFVLILTASLLMPEYINGRLQIDAPGLNDLSGVPLHFGMENVTALLYVLFGSLIALCIARRNIGDDDARITERTYLAAATLTCVLGVAEFVSHALHLPSPTLLFRNSASHGAAGYLAVLTDNVSRVSSVAVEPSILSQYLISALPLSMSAMLGNGNIFSRRLDRFAFFLLIAVLLLTTSSVAYIALLVTPFLCFPVLSRLGIATRKTLWRMVLGGLASFAVAAGLYLFSSTVREVLDLVLFAKAGSFSSLERLKTISLAWGDFRAYPLLGVGWGSVTSHDLVMKILANSGILGLGAFCLLVAGICVPLFRSLRETTDPARGSKAIWLLAVICLLFSSVISEFPVVFGHLWVILGMGMAASLPNYRHTFSTSDRLSGKSGAPFLESSDDQRFLSA